MEDAVEDSSTSDDDEQSQMGLLAAFASDLDIEITGEFVWV